MICTCMLKVEFMQENSNSSLCHLYMYSLRFREKYSYSSLFLNCIGHVLVDIVVECITCTL